MCKEQTKNWEVDVDNREEGEETTKFGLRKMSFIGQEILTGR